MIIGTLFLKGLTKKLELFIEHIEFSYLYTTESPIRSATTYYMNIKQLFFFFCS